MTRGLLIMEFECFQSYMVLSRLFISVGGAVRHSSLPDNVASSSRAMTRPCQSLNLAVTMVRTPVVDNARTSP